MREQDYVMLDGCYVHCITEKAMKITFEGEEFWVPLSQVRDPDQFEKWDEDVDIEVTEWFAKKENLR